MKYSDFLVLYRCKTAYNQDDLKLDTLASIRQEKLDGLAKAFSLKVAKHERFDELRDRELVELDDLIRPFVQASRLQRKFLMYERLARKQRDTG